MDKSLSPSAAEFTADTLLTKEQAAQLLGISVGTLNTRIYAKRLIPVPADSVPVAMRKGSGRGVRSFFHADDVIRLQDEITAYKAERAENQKIVDGKKRCSKCKEYKPLSRFCAAKDLNNGLQSVCIDCTALKNRDWVARNPEQRRKSKRAYAARQKQKEPADA